MLFSIYVCFKNQQKPCFDMVTYHECCVKYWILYPFHLLIFSIKYVCSNWICWNSTFMWAQFIFNLCFIIGISLLGHTVIIIAFTFILIACFITNLIFLNYEAIFLLLINVQKNEKEIDPKNASFYKQVFRPCGLFLCIVVL